MTSFSESAFEKRLSDLNNTQQSIQTLSLWLIHHRKRSDVIVTVWMKELQKAKPSKKLTFMYLANDVVQNSKKKGPEFTSSFGTVIVKAYQHVSKEISDDKTQQALNRLVNIWADRSVFDSRVIKGIKVALGDSKRDKSKQEVDIAAKKRKYEKSLDDVVSDITGSPRPEHPPETEELIKALKELESSASSDAAIRQKIASLPAEVSDVNLLQKIADKVAGNQLSKQVEDACLLLADYNGRLQQEMEDRKTAQKMLSEYVVLQKEVAAQYESKFEQYKEKLENVGTVRNELKSHIENLPDLTMLPDVTTGGLAPLPSAGDLFHS